MVINMGVAMAAFFVVFIAAVLLTMPDVDWAPLLLVTLVTNALVPLLFYPFSKTVWMAGDLHFHRYKEGEQAMDLREGRKHP
jgi:hypothetical protein